MVISLCISTNVPGVDPQKYFIWDASGLIKFNRTDIKPKSLPVTTVVIPQPNTAYHGGQ